jgi:hypothetical protein
MHFHACKEQPRRNLTALEQCQIAKLRASCTPAHDCLITCMSSPEGHNVGGGCQHVCFSALHKYAPEPKGWASCGKPGTGG